MSGLGVLILYCDDSTLRFTVRVYHLLFVYNAHIPFAKK
jgi:hypothetical protein